jgi:hypothetical protein
MIHGSLVWVSKLTTAMATTTTTATAKAKSRVQSTPWVGPPFFIVIILGMHLLLLLFLSSLLILQWFGLYRLYVKVS